MTQMRHSPKLRRPVSRRETLMVAGAFTIMPSIISRRLHAVEEAVKLIEVTPGAFVHQGAHELMLPDNLGHIANIGCIIGDEAIAVIDSGGSAQNGSALKQAIQEITERPIRYVIATHVHPDHLFGHAAFLSENPTFVGHRKLPAALQARGTFYLENLKQELGAQAAGTEVIMPGLLVEDELSLDLGNRLLTLKAHPTAHTDNDMTVFDQTSGFLWAGDLLFMDRCPVVDGSLLGWLDLLDRWPDVDIKAVIPGHGPVSAPWPDALKAQQQYLARLRDEVRNFLADGGLLEDAVAALGFDDMKNQWQLFEHYHGRNVSAAYAELEWE